MNRQPPPLASLLHTAARRNFLKNCTSLSVYPQGPWTIASPRAQPTSFQAVTPAAQPFSPALGLCQASVVLCYLYGATLPRGVPRLSVGAASSEKLSRIRPPFPQRRLTLGLHPPG